MRSIALLCALCVSVSSFDLGRFRRNTPVPSAMHFEPAREFTKPLEHPNFLPLCGNGVLNTKADYMAMYDAGHGPLNVSVRVPGAFVKIMVDEACDDGNRLDGDGCSADCMNVDLFQPVCNVAGGDSMEAMAIDGDDVYVCRRRAVSRVGVGMYGIFSNWDAEKNFSVDTMTIDGSSIFMYSAEDAALYAVEKLAAKPPKFVMKLDVRPGERGEFLRIGKTLLLVAKDDTHLRIVDVPAAMLIASFNSTEHMPPLFGVTIVGDVLEVNMMEKKFTSKLDGSKAMLKNVTAINQSFTQSLWGDFSAALVRDMTQLDTSSPDYHVEVVNSTHTLADLDISQQSVAILNPFAYAMSAHVLRNILMPKTPGAVTYHVTGMGEIVTAVLENNIVCHSAARCVLDIPLGFDLMRQKTYVSGGRTYYDELSDLLASEAIDLANRTFREPTAFEFMKMAMKSGALKTPRTVFTVPKTQGVWFLRDGYIYFMGKRGVSVQDRDGWCTPADVAPCPSCHWATSDNACRPCSVASESVAWSVQCRGCSTGGARRLLSSPDIVVSVTIEGASESELAEAFSTTVKNGTEVSVVTTDPAATLRNMSFIISQNPWWRVVVPLQAVYRTEDAMQELPDYVPDPKPLDNGGELVTFLVVGLVVVLVIICTFSFVCCWCLLRRKNVARGDYAKVPQQPAPSTGRLFQVTLDSC